MTLTRETREEAAGASYCAPERHMRASDIRALIPPLGLKEYWYPVLEDKKVKRRPVGLTICGEKLVFFRGGDGQVKCLWNVCPHRGGSLMHGDCHFKGTISCPYHGWTFDGDGNVLAVLPEGPESRIPGNVKQRVYPTQTLKGMVFVWMGEGEPAPIEEDVPPEFFDDITLILYYIEQWPVNWNIALENGGDAHVPYVHRNSVKHLMNPSPGGNYMGGRYKIIKGRAVVTVSRQRSEGGRLSGSARWPRRYYPGLEARWPKHRWRTYWTWLFAPARKRVARRSRWECDQEEWHGGAHHLPAMFRNDHRTDMYTRNSIAITEDTSRQVYFKAVRPSSWVGRVYERVHFRLTGRWTQVTNFSRQDFSAIAPQRYDSREYLSATDSHQVLWRRVVLQARGMMSTQDVIDMPDTPSEEFNIERQKELGKELQLPAQLLKG